MKLSHQLLAVATIILIAAGCKGSSVASSESESKIKQDTLSFLGFYDILKNGDPRPIRNDLNGELPGIVQFVQSHSVNPSGNEAKHLPRLTSKREALLLFTPDTSMVDVEAVDVTVSINGGERSTLEMRPPEKLFKADRPNAASNSRPDVRYSRRAWSVVLPWELVQPGLSLSFNDDENRRGTLSGDAIDWAPPAELVINNIRLGLLTDPPRSEDHAMYLRPAIAGTDYFQTVPLSKMVIAKYDEVTLDSVMVADGTIYTQASDDEGGVYSGDMRQNTAKSTFSVGINLANWGITSSTMGGEEQPQLTQTVIVHHAQGKYSNGVQKHGLSGGNGMLTLLKSTGNEFSHEIGHHFGLGHYPGREEGDDYWTIHHYNSGWGYIGHRERMRVNFDWKSNELREGAKGVPDFREMYSFLKGSMAGGIGGSSSAFSNYTHYTGYETQTRIQPSLNRAMFDADSPTGYSKWNASAQQMESYQPEVPNSDHVWYNSSDGNYRVPVQQGIEVFTILGGYDPVEKTGLLYPAAHSNWGNVFDLPAPAANSSTRQCWLRIDYSDDSSKQIALAPDRMGSNANKLHVQVAVADQPQQANLYCQEPNEDPLLLSTMEFPQDPASLEPPVVVGQEAGYDAYNEVQ